MNKTVLLSTSTHSKHHVRLFIQLNFIIIVPKGIIEELHPFLIHFGNLLHAKICTVIFFFFLKLIEDVSVVTLFIFWRLQGIVYFVV